MRKGRGPSTRALFQFRAGLCVSDGGVDQVDFVTLELGIRSHNSEVFDLRLTDQQAIKWIFMMSGQFGGGQGVFLCQG